MLVYFHSWYSRSVLQVPVTLAEKAVEAIDTALLADWTARPAFSTRLGCIKFSVLPLSNNAFTCKPLILTVAVDFLSDLGLCTATSVGVQGAPETLPLEKAFPRQTLA